MSTESELQPRVDDKTGVPFCAENDCQMYDGKRCKAMGFRPGNICEPAVIELVAELVERREIQDRARGLATRFTLPHNTDAQLWVRNAARHILGEATIIGDYVVND